MPETKVCKDCKLEKSNGDFRRNRGRWLASYCKSCEAIRGKARYAADPARHQKLTKRWREENPDYFLHRNFGISKDDYNEMLSRQGGVCAICREPETVCHKSGTLKRLSVDHCHDTGRIRGLLCNNCNRGLGLLGDSLERVQATVDYLTI